MWPYFPGHGDRTQRDSSLHWPLRQWGTGVLSSGSTEYTFCWSGLDDGQRLWKGAPSFRPNGSREGSIGSPEWQTTRLGSNRHVIRELMTLLWTTASAPSWPLHRKGEHFKPSSPGGWPERVAEVATTIERVQCQDSARSNTTCH